MSEEILTARIVFVFCKGSIVRLQFTGRSKEKHASPKMLLQRIMITPSCRRLTYITTRKVLVFKQTGLLIFYFPVFQIARFSSVLITKSVRWFFSQASNRFLLLFLPLEIYVFFFNPSQDKSSTKGGFFLPCFHDSKVSIGEKNWHLGCTLMHLDHGARIKDGKPCLNLG